MEESGGVKISDAKERLPGHQVLIEGLIADILNEHFGECVELVGIALFRDGSMTFPELVRVCASNFLSLPRDTLNPFTEYSKATFANDQVPFKIVRDALLVLYHHGMVTATANPNQGTSYAINAMEVVNRLLFPMFLDMFPESERAVVQTLMNKSMVPKDALASAHGKAVVEELMHRRIIVTVDSLVTTETSPSKTVASTSKAAKLVVRLNFPELQLSVLKKFILEYIEGKYEDHNFSLIVQELMKTVCSADGTAHASTLRGRVSIGDLSVTDLSSCLAINSHELISSLIRLQQAGVVTKQQFTAVRDEPSQTPTKGRKRGRAKNTKQLLAIANESDQEDDFADLLGKGASNIKHDSVSQGTPSYVMKFFETLEEMESDLFFQLVKAKYGTDAARVYELLAASGQKYEASHIADICAISREDSLKHLYCFVRDGICQMQEIPKVVTSASAAGAGISAMMRAVASSYWLYSIQTDKVRRCLLSLTSNTIVNLRRRFRCEVNRQCRIEDRASLLTKAEHQYLETVHAAQDILEANSIQLVPSLLVMLIRAASC
jgi:hypothetical protein